MSFMCHRASCRAKEGETKVPPMTPPLFLAAASGQGILYFAKKPTFSNSKQKGQCMRLSLRLHWLNIIVCRASIRRFLWEQCSLFAAAFHFVWVEDTEDTCRYGTAQKLRGDVVQDLCKIDRLQSLTVVLDLVEKTDFPDYVGYHHAETDRGIEMSSRNTRGRIPTRHDTEPDSEAIPSRRHRLVHGGDTQHDQAQHGGENALDGKDLEHGRTIGGGVETRACDVVFDVRIKTCCTHTSEELRDNVPTSVEE